MLLCLNMLIFGVVYVGICFVFWCGIGIGVGVNWFGGMLFLGGCGCWF